MGIQNFIERRKLQEIYDIYFDPESEYCLEFYFVDDLEYYGGVDNKQSKKLRKIIKKAEENLWEQMKAFDELNIKRNERSGK